MKLHRVALPVLAMLALAGCEKSKTELLPHEEARTRPPKQVIRQETQLVAAPVPGPKRELRREPIQLGDRSWVPSGVEYRIPAESLRPAGTAAGLSFYAMRWDETPHDRLFTPLEPGVWMEYVEVF